MPTLRAIACDVDGTITDRGRRVSLAAIACIRDLVGKGVEVVLASGNTACFLDALARVTGTSGTIIAENGGAYRIGFSGELRVLGDRRVTLEAYRVLEEYYREKGISLELFGDKYRFSDVAFARTVPHDEVRQAMRGQPVKVLDTGFAIHLQPEGISKGFALGRLAAELGIAAGEFLAVGDSENDVEMLEVAGIGVAVKNAREGVRAVADYVAEKEDGDGFVGAVERYLPYFLDIEPHQGRNREK
ncbi:MAG TPA: phosphoglycolate phosphatase [Methanomicrobiales archaeon]|nr:phosphoglycolate phosphatase [Methanomicrobiales archaeon]